MHDGCLASSHAQNHQRCHSAVLGEVTQDKAQTMTWIKVLDAAQLCTRSHKGSRAPTCLSTLRAGLLPPTWCTQRACTKAR